ncbi:M23 family metallopeptidase [Conexibacter sp. SYSU D00693]|uniref:M23 family metallopeptidase n=1 Tax=Conexibacter sp. SYSU D00693 TaxID=2812560 RepID=UPI00196AAF74|nr:M23 family metallopeptidase [Conexibacter sp. SYSU D00693]
MPFFSEVPPPLTPEPVVAPVTRDVAELPPLGDVAPVLRAQRRTRAARRAAHERRLAARVRFPVRGTARVDRAGAGAFGDHRGSHVHEGQDVFAPAGTPLVALTDSVVLETGSGDGRGNFVALYDRRRHRTLVYLHLQRPASVRTGERLRAGERVGRVGCIGSCWGDHLHLEVRRGRSPQGEPLDPRPLLRRAARAPGRGTA